MHIKAIPQQMRLVAPSLPETLKLRLRIVVPQERLVFIMRTLLDDDLRSLPRGKASHISKTALRHHDVEIVLCLVHVCGHRDDAGYAMGVVFGGTGGGRVHDTVFCGPQEVGRAAETVEHAGAHDAGRVRVGVDVDFDRGVHSNDAQSPDDLGAVGHLLRAEQELVVVLLPVIVKPLESVWRKADRGGGGELQLAGVEQVQKRVLEDFSPHSQVLELGRRETADDGVGDVADSGLQREEVLREAAVLDLVLEELDQIVGDFLGGLVGGGVGGCLVGVVGLDDGHDLFWVDGNVGCADSVLGSHDEEWLAVGGKVGHCDVVETVEGGDGGVDFDDDLMFLLAAAQLFILCSNRSSI
jgi:hypothetical protein